MNIVGPNGEEPSVSSDLVLPFGNKTGTRIFSIRAAGAVGQNQVGRKGRQCTHHTS